MTDEAGNLSIDFLAGFTIFMVTLIYVATLIPGLFIGLQSRSIDYDAVAYRTGVVLVEDPGMPYNPSWETLPNYSKGDILRFGLSLSKDTPNILSPEKISRFFCSTDFVYPDDYRSRAVFGDYPYQFNISFQRAEDNVTQSVGDALPEDYGYSRRVVKVKEHSNATLDFSNIDGPGNPFIKKYTLTKDKTNNATSQVFSVYFNYTYLLENGPANNNPAYQINPLAPSGAGEIIGGEGALINLTGLKKLPTNGSIVNLSSIAIYRSISLAPLGTGQSAFTGPVMNTTDTSPFELYIDGNITKTLPAGVDDNLSLFIPPGVLSFAGQGDSSALLNITMQFSLTNSTTGNPQPDRYLNSTLVQPDGAFDYTYSNPNVTQPSLHNGVVEVAVW
jgi:hypothetical protein